MKQKRAVYELLLREPYVLDIDKTIKPIYGNQEGAEVGYNPKKPGRPGHNDHPYLIGSLRVVLGVGVSPGKQHPGKMRRAGAVGDHRLPAGGLPPAIAARRHRLRK